MLQVHDERKGIDTSGLYHLALHPRSIVKIASDCYNCNVGRFADLLDTIINLFTRRNEPHNRALKEIKDLSAAIEGFLAEYNLQEENPDSRLIFENIGQARIDVITIAYKTRTRIKIAKDSKDKGLPPLLEEVHHDLEMVKRALFNPTLGNAVLDEVVCDLHKSFRQLINELSNRDREAELAAEEQARREAEETRKTRETEEKAKREAQLAAKEQAKREAEETRKTREAEEKAKKEAQLAAKEQAKREAEETRKARETEEKAKREAQLAAKEQAKREAEEAGKAREAEEKAKREAQLAAKEQAKREAEEAGKAREAEEKAKREGKEIVGAELYEGEVTLTIVSPVDFRQIRKLQEYLYQVQDLRLVLISGSVDKGTSIVVSVVKPIPLINILREMPPIEQVAPEGKNIQIMLKRAE